VDHLDNYKIKNLSDLPIDQRIVYKKRNFFGMYWIGFWPFYSIYERHQQWMEWETTPPNGRKIKGRDEMTPYLIAKPFEYALFSKEAEDIGGVPLNVYFTAIVVPTNARIPIFDVDDAYGQLQTLCLSQALLFTKEKTFANLGGGNNISKELKDEFSLLISNLNDEIPGRIDGLGIIEALGYEILDAKLDQIEIGGANKETILETSTLQYIAKEKAEALKLQSEGEAEAVRIKAKAKADAIKTEAEGNLEATKLAAEGQSIVNDVDVKYLKEVDKLSRDTKRIKERQATPGLETLVEKNTNSDTNLLIGGK